MDIIDKFYSYLTPGHFEGIVLFVASSLIMTFIQIKFSKEWTDGLKGVNKYWEGPEILLYICLWIFPIMVFANMFLQMKADDLVWYTLISFMFFGLTGRWGLEWLLAFKGGATQVTSTSSTTEKKVEIKTEETKND